jgi:hypothetical protein
LEDGTSLTPSEAAAQRGGRRCYRAGNLFQEFVVLGHNDGSDDHEIAIRNDVHDVAGLADDHDAFYAGFGRKNLGLTKINVEKARRGYPNDGQPMSDLWSGARGDSRHSNS